MEKDTTAVGRAFEKAIRTATGNPELWVPGIGNGAMGGTLIALASLDDTTIIRIIRESVK